MDYHSTERTHMIAEDLFHIVSNLVRLAHGQATLRVISIHLSAAINEAGDD